MERIAMNQEDEDWLEWLERARKGVATQRQAGRKNGRQRSLGEKACEAPENGWRLSCSPLTSRESIKPKNRREGRIRYGRKPSDISSSRSGTSSVQRAVGQETQPPDQQRKGARLDGGGGTLASEAPQAQGGSPLAAGAKRPGRVLQTSIG